MPQALVNYKFVSGDGHVTEPGNLWVERMDRRFRDRAPRVISGTELHTEPGTRTSGMSLDTTNSDFFVIDGLLPVDFIDMIATMANEKAEHSAIAGRGHNRASDSRIGATDPHARLADQDLDNLRAEVLYPNYAMYMFGTLTSNIGVNVSESTMTGLANTVPSLRIGSWVSRLCLSGDLLNGR